MRTEVKGHKSPNGTMDAKRTMCRRVGIQASIVPKQKRYSRAGLLTTGRAGVWPLRVQSGIWFVELGDRKLHGLHCARADRPSGAAAFHVLAANSASGELRPRFLADSLRRYNVLCSELRRTQIAQNGRVGESIPAARNRALNPGFPLQSGWRPARPKPEYWTVPPCLAGGCGPWLTLD